MHCSPLAAILSFPVTLTIPHFSSFSITTLSSPSKPQCYFLPSKSLLIGYALFTSHWYSILPSNTNTPAFFFLQYYLTIQPFHTHAFPFQVSNYLLIGNALFTSHYHSIVPSNTNTPVLFFPSVLPHYPALPYHRFPLSSLQFSYNWKCIARLLI